MSARFQPSRSDGRSDRQVIYDLTHTSEPDSLWTYDELADALEVGLDGTVDRQRIYSAVKAANRELLTRERRYLAVVKRKGYRMLRANEHLPVALNRKSSAVTQLARGVELLRNAKISELTEAQRHLHQGQLMIMGSLHAAILDSERRHDRTEAVLDQIRAQQEEVASRLAALEAQQTD